MNLDVLIPSLFLPAPILKLIPQPNVPVLERMLARADRQSEAAATTAGWLCERWGIEAPYPVAPLFAKHDGLDVSNDSWLIAEPVHLVPDRDRLMLFPARFLELQAAEVAKLIAKLNSHFADRHLRFHAPTDDRWYVSCAPSEIPETTPPNVARVGSLTDHQPKSKGKLNWRSLQNEVQMLFFDHPVNEARAIAGMPLVSGTWFWGGGTLPSVRKPAYDRVVAGPGLATLLAEHSGIDVKPLSWDAISTTEGNVLAVLDSCAVLAEDADLLAWESELTRVDREWFQPISRALGTGAIQHLTLHVPDGERTLSFCLSRRNHLLRFWRSAKPLSTYA